VIAGQARDAAQSSAASHDRAMDDRRVGLIIRAIRRRRGWRQVDLAKAAGLAQTTISAIERGHLDSTSISRIRRVLGALDARVDLEVRWRGGALDRVVDDRHARLVGLVVHRLQKLGWVVEVEVTYAVYGERGSIDVLGFHRQTGSILVIEVKSELTSIEETLRRLDEKVRLAPRIARERFGWQTSTTSRVLVIREDGTSRRRVARHAAVLDSAFPARGVEVRHWLATPVGSIRARWFLPLSSTAAGRRAPVGPDRVRRPVDDRSGARTERTPDRALHAAPASALLRG
jgi:transcriptional regulator with XRE-family HTH domain